ncbi:MAG: hypothetical protein QHI48_05730 [Bacteroidota bacterium]|nr:hypothetical protein [Bacteroidota bacterium]
MKGKELFPLAVLFSCLFSFNGCDFPDDPPLKNGRQEPEPVVEIDSARSLLPLRTGNFWQYLVIPRDGIPQPLVLCPATETTYDGVTYYELKYLYFCPSNYAETIAAFPPVLRWHAGGLSFHEHLSPLDTASVRTPRLMYTLPYPAPVGTRVENRRSEYTVVVAAKDTLIPNFNGTASYRCYRYDLSFRNRPASRIYAIPGSALLRIEKGDLVFHTTDWVVK